MIETSSLALVGLYFLLLIGIGFWLWKKETLSDFLIADRKLTPIQAGGSWLASWVDGPLLFTTITIAFSSLWGVAWFYAGIVVGLFIYVVYAPKLRNIAADCDAFTYPTLIYKNIGIPSGITLSILSLICWLGFSALQFVTGAQILEQLAGIKYEHGVVLMGFVVGLYMIMGGFKASVVTDIVQMSFLLIVCGILLFTGQETRIEDFNIGNNFLEEFNNNIWSTIAVIFAVMFAADGIPRMFASFSDKAARKSVWVAIVGFVVLGAFFGYFGFAASIIDPSLNPDDVPVWVFTQYLPDQFFPFALVALFGLIMSSADTYILVAAQSITTDLLLKFNVLDNKRPRLNIRFGIVGITILSIGIAFLYTEIVDFYFYLIMFLGIGAPALIALMHNMNKNPSALAISCSLSLATHIILLATGELTGQISVIVNTANFLLWFMLEKTIKRQKT